MIELSNNPLCDPKVRKMLDKSSTFVKELLPYLRKGGGGGGKGKVGGGEASEVKGKGKGKAGSGIKCGGEREGGKLKAQRRGKVSEGGGKGKGGWRDYCVTCTLCA